MPCFGEAYVVPEVNEVSVDADVRENLPIRPMVVIKLILGPNVFVDRLDQAAIFAVNLCCCVSAVRIWTNTGSVRVPDPSSRSKTAETSR